MNRGINKSYGVRPIIFEQDEPFLNHLNQILLQLMIGAYRTRAFIVASTIDYYFTCTSPFVFLGHRAFLDMADRHNKTVVFKPFSIAAVWAESGSVPLPQRTKVRQQYRLIELQRAAQYRKLKMNINPAHYPTDATLADLCCAALVIRGENPAAFLKSVTTGLWAEQKQIADDKVLASLLDANGHDADAVLSAANEPEATALRAQNSEDAITAGAVGAPAYVYKGEAFWGQDRIEYLDVMLSSGRSAFSA